MLSQKQAIAQLAKLYGKAAAWRINKAASTPAERAVARDSMPSLQARATQAKEAMEERRKALLQDPDYQRLIAEHKEARDAVERASGAMRSRRITVGKTNSIFFHVTGEGDTWEEALEQARSKSA